MRPPGHPKSLNAQQDLNSWTAQSSSSLQDSPSSHARGAMIIGNARMKGTEGELQLVPDEGGRPCSQSLVLPWQGTVRSFCDATPGHEKASRRIVTACPDCAFHSNARPAELSRCSRATSSGGSGREPQEPNVCDVCVCVSVRGTSVRACMEVCAQVRV